MKQVVISADSTCDLSPELVEKYHITILPLTVVLGEELRTDGVDVKPEDLFSFVDQTGVLPKTSAVTIATYLDFFNKLKEEDKEVVHICIGSKFSCCYQNACLAAEESGNAFVVDSCNLSTGSGLLVLEAARMAEEGLCAKEILERLQEIVPHVDASFVIDAIPYLYKGGRCSGVAAFGANLLKIKPCIEVHDGAMVVGKKYRGKMQEVIRSYVDARLNQPDVSVRKHRVFITHTCVHPELVEIALQEVKNAGMFAEILETRAGSTISSHCGPDTLGVLFIREK